MRRRGERKLTVWKYDDGKGTTLKVPVYQVDRYLDDGRRGIRLRVQIAELDILEYDTDINVLQKRVYGQIKEKLVLKWEWFLLVRTYGHESGTDPADFLEATHVNPSCSFRLEVDVERIQMARRPDGTTCWRHAGNHGGTINEFSPELGRQANGSIVGMIPDTPENRRAIVEVGLAFTRLRENLQILLGNDQIERTMEVLSSGHRPQLTFNYEEVSPNGRA
jgi:hypothetical protein